MEQEQKVSWIEKAIEFEAIPEELREKSKGEFIKEIMDEHGISQRTYYYQIAKKEHQERIIEIALKFAKTYTPEILHKLAKKAGNDNEATKIFFNYILKLAENLNIKVDPYDEEQILRTASEILRTRGKE